MRWMDHWMGRAVVFVVALFCAFAAPTAEAQSKNSAKQTASLEKAGEASRTAVRDALGSFGSAPD